MGFLSKGGTNGGIKVVILLLLAHVAYIQTYIHIVYSMVVTSHTYPYMFVNASMCYDCDMTLLDINVCTGKR